MLYLELQVASVFVILSTSHQAIKSSFWSANVAAFFIPITVATLDLKVRSV